MVHVNKFNFLSQKVKTRSITGICIANTITPYIVEEDKILEY